MTYEVVTRHRQRIWPTHAELRSGLRNGSESAVGGMGGAFAVLGGILLGGYAAIICLTAGPLGWFVGLTVVPLAFCLGAALGLVGFVALLALLAIGLPIWLLTKLV